MSLLHVHSRRAAYVALAALTLVWGFNWIVMKAALINADPLEFNMHRTWLAICVLFAALAEISSAYAASSAVRPTTSRRRSTARCPGVSTWRAATKASATLSFAE